MALTPGDPVVGGIGALVRAFIRSPDFVHGVSGWSINKDGSAEFNDLDIRGTFNGTDYVVNAAGIFFYSGAPALGNLVISLTQASGTDTFGNVYPAGLNMQPGAARPNINQVPNFNTVIKINIGSSLFTGIIQPASLFGSGDANENLPGLVASCLFNVGAANQFPALLISSALLSVSGPGILTGAIMIRSTSDDGAIQAQVDIGQIANLGGVFTFTASLAAFQSIGGFASQLVVAQDLTMVAANPSASSIQQPEVWHDLGAFTAGYSIGVNSYAKYRINPVNATMDLAIRNLIHDGTTANPDNTVILSVAHGFPIQYEPLTAKRLVAYCNVSRAPTEMSALEIEPDGSMQCFGMAVASTRVDCYATGIPLDI